MLDPAILRDNLEAVRTASAETWRRLVERARRAGHARSAPPADCCPELEGLKREQNTSGDEVARAKRQGIDASKIQEASRQRAQQIKQLERRARHRRAATQSRAADDSQSAARERAGRQEQRRQRRGAATRNAAHVRFQRRSRTGISGRRSASSTSSAARRSRAPGSPC